MMKATSLVMALALMAPAVDGYCQQETLKDLKWETAAHSVEYAHVDANLFNSVMSISVLRYNPKEHFTDMVNDPAEESDSTSAIALRHGGIAAINGSYFNMRKLTPTTFIMDEGEVEGWTTPDEMDRVESVLAISKKGKVDMFLCDTASYVKKTRKYKDALAAGPMLLMKGKPMVTSWSSDSFFTKRHPRSFVGKSADGRYVYFVVVDGRFPGLADGATIMELAEIAAMLGCRDAINIDGGGSSTLWIKGKGVISFPYDNRRYDHYGQRVVPNIVLIQ